MKFYNKFPYQIINDNLCLRSLKLKPYKKVRLKSHTSDRYVNRIYRLSNLFPNHILKLIIIIISLWSINPVMCNNHSPKFLLDDGQSEIVLRLKEGLQQTPIGSIIFKLRGYDPDGDQLTFGIQHSYDSDVIRIETLPNNEANIYLNKELDRETKDEYSIILTLTDNRLGDGNYVAQSLLLLVDDVNDNEPIFKPYQSALEVRENSKPGVLTTLEATDRDEGAYGQVVYYLQELDGDNDYFSIATYHGKGVIRQVRSLDYERKALYQLRVLAVDRANQGPVNTGTAALIIKVKDEDDELPVFTTVNPVTRISEDAKIGSYVLQVKAHDGDRGINNPIKYTLLSGGSGLFDIDGVTGVVHTIQLLDRENPVNQQNGAYILKIAAQEQSNVKPAPSVQTEVTIILTDVNDETPTFRSEYYEAEVNENAQDNTPVTFAGDFKNSVFDFDQGLNGTFELYLQPNTGIFEILPKRAINEATFIIRVKNASALDFEYQREMNFTAVAEEIAGDRKYTTTPVRIFIRDSNDNFPEFTKELYEFSIPENSQVGTIIGRVQAVDRDSGYYGTQGIRFTKLSGSIANLLNLDPITGAISIKEFNEKEFDRELNSEHYLTVEARDNVGQGNRNTIQIIVYIEDVNDNAPEFREQRYTGKLFENSLRLEQPLVVVAIDSDQRDSLNSRITYEIIDGDFPDNFQIDPVNGTIGLNEPIDFESQFLADSGPNPRPLQLVVLAKDSGMPSLFNKVNVIIYLYDLNDNAPGFEQNSYKGNVLENSQGGSSIIKVSALDNDGSSPNNLIVYRIQNGAKDKFVISSDTGIISVAQGASLDPDLNDPKLLDYSLTVIALDGGLGDEQLSTSVTVNITILDVNNKVPIFNEPEKLTINENTPVGTYVYTLTAYDLDENPMLRYSFDGSVSEARSEEGVLIKVSEYDYINSFNINSLDGKIKIARLIDRERVEQIKLGVVVQDIASATGQQISTSFLNIIIEDVNDNNPKFRKPFYKRAITENSPIGLGIANVAAYDIDKNRTIKYGLEGPRDILKLMQIDEETGELVVINKIDHEEYQWLNYTVRATDFGVPARSSLVDIFIRVIDENDNNPIFIGDTTNFTVRENSPIHTRIDMITAKDADSGDFGKITFLIDKMSSQGKFSIDADTGVLIVADDIDREVKSGYMLVIEAWDNYQFGYLTGESRNSFKQFYITVIDENDNPPMLHLPGNPVQITEYHDLKDIVAHIRADDADDRNTGNGRLEFSITEGTGKDHFKIIQRDPWTAEIYAKHSLQNFYGNYTLRIKVTDLGTPRNSVESVIEILVLDFNDHAPIFVTPTHNVTIRVPENATIGTNIIQVKAIDKDEGANAAVLYRLKPDLMGNHRTFSIDQSTGLITLQLPLDRERKKIYDIRVEAYDQGIPTPLSTDLDLTIYVRNINDYEPQFLIEEISVHFTEHAPIGAEKIKLPDTVDRDEVDDLDDPPSKVCYFIVYGNEDRTFELDPVEHILTALKELDREIKPNHTLIVKATENCLIQPEMVRLENRSALNHQSELTNDFRNYDRHKHSRTVRHVREVDFEYEASPIYDRLINDIVTEDNTLVQIIIHIDDINDNPPEFLTKVFTGGVTTAADFGQTVMKIEAVDRDVGMNALIYYYQLGEIHRTLTEGLEHVQKSPFLVDRVTGAVILNFDPQKGMKGYFDFMVVANNTNGLQDTAHVFIYLLREDQRVRFVLRQQPAQIRNRIQIFREILGNVTNAIVNVDDFKIHENRDGSVDKTKTDLYMHLVDKRDNSIFDVTDVLRMVDQNVEKLDNLFKEFNVLDTQPSEALLFTGSVANENMLIWLVFTNIFAIALLVVVLSICFTQRKDYRRQLRAACVHAYGPPSPDLTIRGGLTSRVPNTNKHSMEGSNPIWLKAYENEWFRSDDDLGIEPDHNVVGPDSLDENVLTSDNNYDEDDQSDCHLRNKELNGYNTHNNLAASFNVYQQIDKMALNAQILSKKLETTEL